VLSLKLVLENIKKLNLDLLACETSVNRVHVIVFIGNTFFCANSAHGRRAEQRRGKKLEHST
jgi:hypothetical protein